MSAVLILATTAMQLPAPPPLTPAGPWKVEYAQAQCLLSRSFGAPADRLTLVLSGDWIAERYSLFVIGPQTGGNLRRGRIAVSFGPDIAPIEVAAESSLNAALNRRVLTTRIEGAAIATSTRVELTPVSGDVLPSTLKLVVGAMTKPWQAFDLCRANLAKSWGVDAESLSRIDERAKAVGNPGEFFGAEDYPAAAKALKVGGEVRARLAVDATGKPVGCHIVKTSPLASLDAETCAIVLQHVRYRPAKAKDGTPVSSEVPLTVTWHPAQ